MSLMLSYGVLKLFDTTKQMQEAKFWTYLNDVILCHLCPHECSFKIDGDTGLCKGRVRKGRVLIAESYGEISALQIDPIEKKPLYHFYPGSTIISIGSWGCNFACANCQNWNISQQRTCVEKCTPEQIKNIIVREENLNPKICGVAYTYNEPLVNFEFVYDIAMLVKQAGLRNVIVSNGFINVDPLKNLLPYLDAANIDVKSFSNGFYQRVCHGSLEPVLKTVEILLSAGIHVELTWLLIPGENDSEKELNSFIRWVEQLGVAVPVHFSAYSPRYKANWAATQLTDLDKFKAIALSRLPFVYTGNTGRAEDDSIICAKCKKLLLCRHPRIINYGIKDGSCVYCGCDLSIVGI